MEKKNTVLLTVIAVATLLVAVVGATFAYFTATSTGNANSTGTATATTTNVAGVTLTMDTNTNFSQADYPGGYIVTGVVVDATDADTTYDFNATYSIGGQVVNGLTSSVKYTVYRTTSEIAANALVTGCSLQETQSGTSTNYYYTGCTRNAAFTSGATVVAETTVTGGQTGTVSITDQTQATSNAGTKAYYYLVVEYPNNAEASQNDDFNKTVTASLTTLTAGSYARIGQ